MKNLVSKFLLVLMSAFSFNVQAFVTVGWTSDCDYDESITTGQVQAAVDDGETEIRVTNEDIFTEQVVIGNQSIIIKGAYNSCTDATNDMQSSDLTQISGETFTQSAFNINSNGSPANVTIDGFEIFNVALDGNGSLRGAGVKISLATGTVLLKNMNIHHNLYSKGGIEITNPVITSNLSLNLNNVISAYNTAFRGAGLNCYSNNMTHINIDGLSGFSFNEAQNFGGGMSLDGCSLTFNGGTGSQDALNLLGINANVADTGGGIAAFGGSQLMLIGSQSVPFNISNNSAKDGGGIYAGGSIDLLKTKVQLTNSWLVNNEAYNRYGGAVYAYSEGEVVFIASDGCQWNDLCHLIENNTANNDGGAFFLQYGGLVEVNKAEITGSRSGYSGTVAAMREDDNSLTINNSLIHHNGGSDHTEFSDSYAIRNLKGAAEISINYSTFANNEIQYGVITPFRLSGSNLAGHLSLIGTIIADDVSALGGAGIPENWTATSVVNCVMFKEIFVDPNLFQAYQQVIEGEPTFVDADNGNYRLNATDVSAIDQCDEVNYPAVIATDVDGQQRPFDNPNVVNGFGTLDIGYDEVNFDLIFKNGFE